MLPVRCLDFEDLEESTEGYSPVLTEAGKRVFKSIPMETMPPLLGYNKTFPIKEGRVLLKVKETGDPLVAVRKLGKGRVLAYMSDPAPHWGCNFIFWKSYNAFWLACLDWALNG
jgi:uncharacterized membrane protein